MSSLPRIIDESKKESNVVVHEYDEIAPVPPFPDGDGTVFVAIPSYRDGERCGATLKSIFENASDPEKVFVGIAEQNEPGDKFCIEEYCNTYGIKIVSRVQVRADVTKVMLAPDAAETCPHYEQIRQVAFYHVNAKGPLYARAMTRKVLGNEEYCMQMDAHSSVSKGWDDTLRQQWKMVNNEFAVISTVPPPLAASEEYEVGGTKANTVPRICRVKFQENGFPDYDSPADAVAVDLDAPLLANGWSAAFSFAKCHLEETTPYDSFNTYAKPIEQFSRYARFWTRGYDVYTPSVNAVFHDYGEQPNGHGGAEWFKHRRDRFRLMSIQRVKTTLQMPDGEESVSAQANLGLYGIGKRRSLEQLQAFVGIDLVNKLNNRGVSDDCANLKWVPYDASISPLVNLFDKPDGLDPQPEYPLRSNFVFYEQFEEGVPALVNKLDVENVKDRELDSFNNALSGPRAVEANTPPLALLFTLWLFGLMVACAMTASSKKASLTSAVTKRKSESAKEV